MPAKNYKVSNIHSQIKDFDPGDRSWDVYNISTSKSRERIKSVTLRMDCGAIHGMQSGWSYTTKNEDGTTRQHKWQCQACAGNWMGKKGGSRAVQGILPSNTKAEPFKFFLVLDEPPQDLWEQHVKRRLEYYTKFEGTDPLRDRLPSLEDSKHYAQRLRAEGEASVAMWMALIGPNSEENVSKLDAALAKIRGNLG
jgi:hypothetical protein